MPQDERMSTPRRFVINVEQTLRLLLQREDTDGNEQITIEDLGPKVGLNLILCTATWLIR